MKDVGNLNFPSIGRYVGMDWPIGRLFTTVYYALACNMLTSIGFYVHLRSYDTLTILNHIRIHEFASANKIYFVRPAKEIYAGNAFIYMC